MEVREQKGCKLDTSFGEVEVGSNGIGLHLPVLFTCEYTKIP